jgi:hypothetical protein
MRCFREGNVIEFRRLQRRHEHSLWRLGLTVRIFFCSRFSRRVLVRLRRLGFERVTLAPCAAGFSRVVRDACHPAAGH